ncbi:hypothetical protein M8C21_012426 [Ambrosia artemisiifolia]|uniref:Nucleolar protein 14 n=1 Tax=Ambrosia artemisiifolia TaxID=4212 RepID=A0AAD5CY14_AMBAR|nr:hypothetical protein M8C21_012426 [Ambrosia artemisiifolia]
MVKVIKATNNNGNTDKKKKNKKINPNAVAMKVKAPAATKPNPFETIWSRRKFDILGKKRKGEERRIGLARSLAIEKRKKTLLKDYERSGKSSVFVDKRIGEQNEDLGEFDKAILRTQRELRVKLSKKSRYNLSDGEEDEYEDQEGGLYPERDDFDDEVPFDEEDQEAAEAEKRSVILKQLSADGTPGARGAESNGERQKSKKEVYDEIISKSKFFKAEKAKDKEENDQLIKKLDEQFTSLQSIKNVYPKKVEPDQEKADAYDKLLNEMVLDMRARPSNRTKTPEELAQDEKERLEELEEERQKRMHAADDTSDDDDAGGDDHGNSTSKKLTSISGDDLGDSFDIDEPKTKLAWIQQIERLLAFCEDVISLEALICKQSKKFCPEALVFLQTLLMAALEEKPGPSLHSELYHLMELKSPKPLLRMRGTVDEIKPLDFLMLMDSPDDSPYFTSDNFRASMLAAVVDTLQGYVNIYEEFKSFPEIFLPISSLLTKLEAQDHTPDTLKDKINATVQLINKKVDEHHMLRLPLQMRKQKPVPIKLLNPKFEEKDYDPDRQRAEERKLKKLVKREAKGAIRELRKDNYFVADVKARDKARLEEEKAAELGRNKAFLQDQEHAFKSGQLGKGRKRRR